MIAREPVQHAPARVSFSEIDIFPALKLENVRETILDTQLNTVTIRALRD